MRLSASWRECPASEPRNPSHKANKAAPGHVSGVGQTKYGCAGSSPFSANPVSTTPEDSTSSTSCASSKRPVQVALPRTGSSVQASGCGELVRTWARSTRCPGRFVGTGRRRNTCRVTGEENSNAVESVKHHFKMQLPQRRSMQGVDKLQEPGVISVGSRFIEASESFEHLTIEQRLDAARMREQSNKQFADVVFVGFKANQHI